MNLLRRTAVAIALVIALIIGLVSYLTFRGERGDRFDQACLDGNVQAVRFWLTLGADPTGRQDLAYSSNAGEPEIPFLDAAESGKPEIVRLLLAAGADVNQHDGEGNNALGVAIIHNYPEVVRVLVDAGANTHYRSPLATAKRLGRPEIAAYLESVQGQ